MRKDKNKIMLVYLKFSNFLQMPLFFDVSIIIIILFKLAVRAWRPASKMYIIYNVCWKRRGWKIELQRLHCDNM